MAAAIEGFFRSEGHANAIVASMLVGALGVVLTLDEAEAAGGVVGEIDFLTNKAIRAKGIGKIALG